MTLTAAEMAQLAAEDDAYDRRCAMHEARHEARLYRARIDAEWNALPDGREAIRECREYARTHAAAIERDWQQ